MALFPILCGLVGATCSDYYPLLKVAPEAPIPVKSLVRLTNSSIAYLLVARVAELALNVIESITLTPWTSQHSHVLLFLASAWFVFSIPRIETFIRKHFKKDEGGAPL